MGGPGAGICESFMQGGDVALPGHVMRLQMLMSRGSRLLGPSLGRPDRSYPLHCWWDRDKIPPPCAH